MIFTRKKHIDTDISLSIDGEPIYEVQKTKFLGVIIDKELTRKEHIALTAETYLGELVWWSKLEITWIKVA